MPPWSQTFAQPRTPQIAVATPMQFSPNFTRQSEKNLV
jgi:hypothetical protein